MISVLLLDFYKTLTEQNMLPKDSFELNTASYPQHFRSSQKKPNFKLLQIEVRSFNQLP